jgi:hypothetical protein
MVRRQNLKKEKNEEFVTASSRLHHHFPEFPGQIVNRADSLWYDALD